MQYGSERKDPIDPWNKEASSYRVRRIWNRILHATWRGGTTCQWKHLSLGSHCHCREKQKSKQTKQVKRVLQGAQDSTVSNETHQGCFWTNIVCAIIHGICETMPMQLIQQCNGNAYALYPKNQHSTVISQSVGFKFKMPQRMQWKLPEVSFLIYLDFTCPWCARLALRTENGHQHFQPVRNGEGCQKA